MKIKSILVAGIAVVAAASQAQVLNADASLALQFNTDANVNSFATPTTITGTGRGVGFGSNTSWFPQAQADSNAITHWNYMYYNGSSFNTGDDFQFGVHAYAVNAALPTNNGTAPTSIYVSIYQAGLPTANPTPGLAIVENLEIKVRNNTSSAALSERIYYTEKTSLLRGLASGSNYMLKFAPSVTGSAISNYTVLVPRSFSTAGTSLSSMSASQKDMFRREWITNTNTSVSTIYRSVEGGQTSTNPIAYRMYAAAVPEPTTMTALVLGALALVRKRRAN